MQQTLTHLIDRHGIDVLEHLARDVEVPVLTGPQCQGDLIILPEPKQATAGGSPIPREGIPVVRGENGGNTHTILGDGEVLWSEARSLPDLGYVTVPEGGTAFLAHPEHGYSGIGPGVYRIRRQREQAEEVALVAD